MSDDITAADFDSVPASDPSSGAPLEADGVPDPPPTEAPEAPSVPAARVATDGTRGPIPLDAHERVLKTTREAYEAQLQQLAWANGLRREDVAEALEWRDAIQRNPKAVYDHLHTQFQQPDEPQPDFQTEDGTPLFSAARMKAYVQQTVQQIVADKLAAVEQRVAPMESERQLRMQWQQAEQTLAEVERWPGWTEESMGQAAHLMKQARDQHRPITVGEAYIQVVVPTLVASKASLTAEAKRAILAEMNTTSAQAQDDLDPARTPSASRKHDGEKEWGELIAEEVVAASR